MAWCLIKLIDLVTADGLVPQNINHLVTADGLVPLNLKWPSLGLTPCDMKWPGGDGLVLHVIEWLDDGQWPGAIWHRGDWNLWLGSKSLFHTMDRHVYFVIWKESDCEWQGSVWDTLPSHGETLDAGVTLYFTKLLFWVIFSATWTVWYKTKFGSQNFGYQLWYLFCNINDVFKNMFNVGLIMMW